MLKKLIIEQFVIIDRLDLDWHSGLTVLTGETGAGKSILLDAMGLILGDAPNPEAIRQGAEQALIEARFAPPAASAVWKFLAEGGLYGPQQELTIRRVVMPDGEDDISVNGQPVPLEQLKKLGTYLCEIHGQNANQSLLDPSNQLNLLDLSGDFPPEIMENVANALRDLHRYTQEREDETSFFTRNIQNMSKIEDLVARFEAIGLHEHSIEEIYSEYERLIVAHETSEVFQEITSHLVASNGAIKALSAANMALERQENIDAEKLEALAEYLSAALENARAAVNETSNLAPEYDIDTRPLRLYKDKLLSLQKISEEVQVHMEDLPAFYDETVVSLERLRNSRERIAELAKLIEKSDLAYRHHAHILTEKRIEAGKRLSEAINANLPPLKLMGAEFKVQVEEKPNDPWTEIGFNIVTFMARMNPGQPFSRIAETASGGELARMVLALKAVLQSIQTIPTLVFDEVDTGIGGGAAAAVGERIAQLAETTQVLVITHSPQVASRGAQHLHVSKKSDGVSTTSVVRQLTIEERTDEISRMLAGDTITAESHAAAKKLLDEAGAAAQARRRPGEVAAAE